MVRARYEVGGDKFVEAVEEAVELLYAGLDVQVVREAVGFGSLGREIVAAAKLRIAQCKPSSPNALRTERAA